MMAMIVRPLTSACAVALAFQLLTPSMASAQFGRLGRRIADAASDQVGREIENRVRDGVRCAFRDLACIERAKAEGKTPVMTDDDGNLMMDADGKPMTDPNAAAAKAGAMPQLADKLESCEVFAQGFTHPLTGDLMGKNIAGIADGKCLYIEDMPRGGKMECRYSEASRKAVAQFYRDTANAKSSGTQVRISLSDGKQERKYTIDGKEVTNPLQASLDNGTCVTSGY